jgi:endonuclease/exonuclease/phosphatase family metal-dependent hydrolase
LRKFLNRILFYVNIVAGVSLLLSYLSTHISPAKIWIFAFFGLAYPYIFLLNLVFMFFYIYRRKKKFLFSLIIILSGINHLNAFLPVRIGRLFDKSQEKRGLTEIKILSFNVRAFNIYEWYSNPQTSKAIVNLILSENPDIICLQEYYTSPRSKYKPENIFSFFKNTPFHHIRYSFQNGLNSGYGIATFSKFPIINKGTISFQKTINEIIYSDMIVNDDTIRIYNNHLQSVKFQARNYAFLDTLRLKYDEENLREILDISVKLKTAYIKRSEQADIISAHINNCPYPVIACGDFNDTPVSYTYRKMRRGLKDAFLTSGKGLGNTYLGIFPYFRIDYIFHSKEFHPLIFERVKVELSDHYPIICILDLKE